MAENTIDDPELLEAADRLLIAGADFHAAKAKPGMSAAVQWVRSTDGALALYTRGEYADRIAEAVVAAIGEGIRPTMFFVTQGRRGEVMGGPFAGCSPVERDTRGGAQCSPGLPTDYEEDEGGPGYMGAVSWGAFHRADTKCLDPATEPGEAEMGDKKRRSSFLASYQWTKNGNGGGGMAEAFVSDGVLTFDSVLALRDDLIEKNGYDSLIFVAFTPLGEAPGEPGQ